MGNKNQISFKKILLNKLINFIYIEYGSAI